MMTREEIFLAIEMERERQEILHPLPKLKKTDNPDVMAMEQIILSAEFMAILAEEVGEVGSACQGDSDLQTELIHVASVCVRWLENMK
jgi:hypothetical protein